MRTLKVAVLSVCGFVLLANAAARAQSPAQEATPAKPAASSNAEGKALLAKVIQAMGGAEKLNAVHSFRQKATLDVKSPQGEFNMDMETVSVFPDQSYAKITTPMGDMTMVATPKVSFMDTPQGMQEMPAEQQDEMLKELRRSEIFVAQHQDDPKVTLTASGSAKVGDVDAQILDVNADGAEVRWYIDPQTGRILRNAAHVVGMQGPTDQVVDLSGWKEFGGITMPTKAKVTQNGEEAATLEVTEIEINPTVDPKLFQKPPQ